MNKMKELEEEVEVIEATELSVLDTFKPQAVNTYIQEPDEEDENKDSKLAEGISKTMSDLANSLDISAPETDPIKVMDMIGDITADNQKAFDLLATKTISTMYSRARTKAMIAGDMLMSKLSDMASQLDKYDYAADPMNYLLFIEKYADYIERMDNLHRKYSESVDESLIQMSQDTKKKEETSKVEKLTPSQRADMALKIQEMLKNNNKEN